MCCDLVLNGGLEFSSPTHSLPFRFSMPVSHLLKLLFRVFQKCQIMSFICSFNFILFAYPIDNDRFTSGLLNAFIHNFIGFVVLMA